MLSSLFDHFIGSSLGLCLLCVFCQGGYADEKSDRGESPGMAHLTIIALGSVPARRYGVVEGSGSSVQKRQTEAVLLPPRKGSVPPSILYYRIESDNPEVEDEVKGDGKMVESEPWLKLRVGFNRGTSVASVSAGKPLVFFLRRSGETSPYLKLTALLPDAQVLCFLSTSTSGKTPWLKSPKVSLLNLKSQAMEDKNFLVRNFSDQSVSLVIGKGKGVSELLGPGKRRSYKLDQIVSYHRIAAKEKGKRSLIINTSLRVPKDALTVIVFYNIKPKTKRSKSIGVFRATVKRVQTGSVE